MSAIITEQFRRQNAASLLADISSTNNSYYIGIGQQDSWQDVEGTNQISPHPAGTNGDQRRVLEHITGLFRASNTARVVVPRYTIDPTKQYKVYDPYDATCFYPSSTLEACFVCSKPSPSSTGNHIFLCIAKTIDATVASESSLAIGDIDHDSEGVYQFNDGYTWVYLGRYLENSELNTNSFMAISNDPTTTDQNIGSLSRGLFYGLHLINGGNIYVNTGTSIVDANVKLSGYKVSDLGVETYVEDTFPVKVRVASNNSISHINFTNNVFDAANPPVLPENPTQEQQDLFNAADAANQVFIGKYLAWDRAKVEILPVTGGLTLLTGSSLPLVQIAASAFANFAPLNGFGKTKFSTLPSWYIGFYCNTNQAVFIPEGTKYRQVSLIKNPTNISGTVITDADYIMPLKYFTRVNNTLSEITSNNLGPGWTLRQNNKDIGIISHIQTVTGNNNSLEEALETYRYYYYQDHRYGYGPEITAGVPLTFKAPSGSLFIDYTVQDVETVESPDQNYKINSGTVLFIDNRGAIERSPGQNEELKVIIQL